MLDRLKPVLRGACLIYVNGVGRGLGLGREQGLGLRIEDKDFMTKIKIFLVLVLFVLPCAYAQPKEQAMTKSSTSNSAAQNADPACALPTSDEELKRILTPEQYRIMRQNGTEQPFKNAYWNNDQPGIYVDAISGEPLFSSKDKFDSGTGWPSFTKPIKEETVNEKQDITHGMQRTEVRSTKSDSHLGHVFDDGPGPQGLRYCINSASLKFVAVEDLEKEGYGEYRKLFEK